MMAPPAAPLIVCCANGSLDVMTAGLHLGIGGIIAAFISQKACLIAFLPFFWRDAAGCVG